MHLIQSFISLAAALDGFKLLAPIVATMTWWFWSVAVTSNGKIFHRQNYYFAPPITVNSAAFLALAYAQRAKAYTNADSPLEVLFAILGVVPAFFAIFLWVTLFWAQIILWNKFRNHNDLRVEMCFLGIGSNLLAILGYALYIKLIGI